MGDLGYDYSGCQVVVTGGTRGIGLAVARAFAEYGAKVIVTGTSMAASTYAMALTGTSSRHDLYYRQLELSDPDRIRDFADALTQVDVLINSAGCRLPGSVVGGEREFVTQAVQLGLAGPAQLVNKLRHKLAVSKISGGGSVIDLQPAQAWQRLIQPSGTDAELSAASVAVGLRRHADRLAVHRIRYNSVVAAVPHEAHEAAVQTEIAAVTLFLASRGAAGLTGQMLAVRAGLSAY